MDTKTGLHADRKIALLNTLSLFAKSSRMALLAVFLVVAILFGTVGNASASNSNGTTPGYSCEWWVVNGYSLGYCYRAVTNTTGYIWIYNGAWQSPWLKSGQYDATYDYLYNFRGGYLQSTERATGRVLYPTSCGWMYANTSCPAVIPNNIAYVGGSSPTTFEISGGNSFPTVSSVYVTISGSVTTPLNPLVAYANSRIIDRLLAPTCDSWKYYC
jgi:hypothetical protein